MDAIIRFLQDTGFYLFSQDGNWRCLIMLGIACVLLYLAIVHQFEPLLLLPIGFGMLMTNLPLDGIFHMDIFINETQHINWELLGTSGGMADYIYLGVKLGIYPPLIFLGIGTMTDFEPLIARPSSLLLGAAAQLGIFFTFVGAKILGFTNKEAASIGIIGGADGPTAIYLTSKLAPHLLGAIAVAAYSYMSLVPLIQPPIMKLMTTKEQRKIKMVNLRPVSHFEKVVFPIVVAIVVSLLLPPVAALMGCLCMGNLFEVSGVTARLSDTAQNALINIVTIFLATGTGLTMSGDKFLRLETIEIIVLGLIAFAAGTAGGVLFGQIMRIASGNKINPLIGSAGVSAVPMAARVSQIVGLKDNPSNYLLMQAMGPNVAGVIGTAVAAGTMLAQFGG